MSSFSSQVVDQDHHENFFELFLRLRSKEGERPFLAHRKRSCGILQFCIDFIQKDEIQERPRKDFFIRKIKQLTIFFLSWKG